MPEIEREVYNMANDFTGIMKDEQPMLTIQKGKTTFRIGMHFNEKSKDTIDDKIKKMIRKEASTYNC